MSNTTLLLTIAVGCCLGLLFVAGCYEESPLQANMSDPAPGPITASELGIGELESSGGKEPKMFPFRGEYDETFVQTSFDFPFNNIEISGVGSATHLGSSTFFGPLQINVLTGAETGSFVFTGEDGVTFSASFVGVALVDGNDIAFSGEWTVTGGTRRFKKLTGGGTASGTGTLEPAVGHIIFEGEISAKSTGRNVKNL